MTNVECGFNFVKGVSMADIKVFRVGAKLKELNPDATAVREATKRGLRKKLQEDKRGEYGSK